MKIKTSELTGAALDWAVAKAADYLTRLGDHWMLQLPYVGPRINYRPGEKSAFSPSTRWAQGGPLIEQEHISIYPDPCDYTPEFKWSADSPDVFRWGGPTPLVAAMRCYVASKLGDEVDVPSDFYCQPTPNT